MGQIFPEPEEAVRHLTTAIGIRPASISARLVLASAFLATEKRNEAEAECREAIRLKPDDPMARWTLGNALRWQGRHEESGNELREAIRLKPDDGRFHNGLAVSLSSQLKFDESLAEYREAIRLRPDDFAVYQGYAQALRRKTDYAGALDVVRKVQALSEYPLAEYHFPPEWVAKIESLAALAERLPALLEGADRPKNNAERVDVGQMCADKNLHAAALRFRGEALDEDPKLGESRRLQLRYNAACSALLVADGRGEDAARHLDEAAKADLRRRALRWLRAEVAAWSGAFDAATTAGPRRRSCQSSGGGPVISTWPRSAATRPSRSCPRRSGRTGRASGSNMRP